MPDEMDKVTEVDILRVLKRSAKNKVDDQNRRTMEVDQWWSEVELEGLLNEEEDSGMDIAQLGITKRELCCMPTRDLNKFLKPMGLTRDEIRSVKAQRRTLKNRRYAVDTQWIHSAV